MSDSHSRLPRPALQTAASAVIILAGSWWLLGQLAGVLRPLLLAVFLAYILLPWYSRLRRSGLPAPVAITGLASFGAVILIGAMQLAYSSAREFTHELPLIQTRLQSLVGETSANLHARFPWLPVPRVEQIGSLADEIGAVVSRMVSSFAGGLIEAATAALYLLFLLLGAERLPVRVRKAYPGDRGEHILDIAGGINSAIISYLRAKVISSLLLALGTGAVLAGFGVKFIAIWMLLAFACNFIPYIGSVVSFALPTAYAALQLDPWLQPALVGILLLGVQVLSATLVEPMLIGRAVGLSPLLVLAALAVWGSIWGVPGMFLAVPLTVVLKIILKNIEATKPLAHLMED